MLLRREGYDLRIHNYRNSHERTDEDTHNFLVKIKCQFARYLWWIHTHDVCYPLLRGRQSFFAIKSSSYNNNASDQSSRYCYRINDGLMTGIMQLVICMHGKEETSAIGNYSPDHALIS